ncbi:MAG: hypothetical protein WA130_05440 [Candidatus Methanoperedens sp.]
MRIVSILQNKSSIIHDMFSTPVRPARIPHAPDLPAGGCWCGRGWESMYRD